MHNHHEIRNWQKYLLEDRWRSIYFSANPRHANCMDLFTALNHVNLLTRDFCNKLLQKEPFHIETKIFFRSTDKFNTLYLEASQNAALSGIHSFGFGFPLFIAGAGEEQIVAPLFIWQLKLQPKALIKDRWEISHEREQPIIPNQYLLEYLEETKNIRIKNLFIEGVKTGSINTDRLVQICSHFSEQLEIEKPANSFQVHAFPTDLQLKKLPPNGAIIWSGILANFPLQLTRIHKRLNAKSGPETKTAREANTSPFHHHNFGVLPGDPSQIKVFKDFQNHKLTLIYGPRGTGKSYTLANILSIGLSNGLKCLVVAPGLPGLLEIKKNLEKTGLDKYCLLFSDPINDKNRFLEIIKARSKKRERASPFDPEKYKMELAACRKSEKELEASIQYLFHGSFGPYNWMEAVGVFLRNNRKQQWALLENQLNENNFRFTFQEFEILKKDLQICIPLFHELQTLKHPLRSLHHSIFLKQNIVEARKSVLGKIEYFLDKFTQLKLRYILKLNEYKGKLSKYNFDSIGEIQDKIEQLIVNINNFTSQFGRSLSRSNGRLRVFSVFSPKYRSILEAKANILQEYLDLQKSAKTAISLEHEFLSTAEARNPRLILINITRISQHLKLLKQNIEEHTSQEISKLSPGNIFEKLDYKEQFEELAYAQQVLIDELNNAQLFEIVVNKKEELFVKRQQLLEDVIEELQDTRLQMRDFTPFYNWQSYWLRLPELPKTLIAALTKLQSNNWNAAFESWYLHHVLKNQFASVETQTYPGLHSSFLKNLQKLRHTIPLQIEYRWHRLHRKPGLRKILKQKDLPLASLMEMHFSELTNYFPIILATPSFVSEILPEKNKLVDLVMVDNAHQLPMEYALPSIQLAPQLVIAGILGASTLSPDRSLLKEMSKAENKSFQLNIQHLKRPQALLQFNDAAFNKGLQFFNRQHSVFSSIASIHAVKGIYDTRKKINQEESIQVIELVLQTEQTPEHVFPSIAVVCFSREQQQLIARRLLGISQGNDKEAEKIRALYKTGLNVYYIEALPSINPNVLIVSLGFGISEHTGKMSSDINYLNQPWGIAQVDLLTNGNYEKIQICHSIPDTLLENWKTMPGQTGFFILSNFVDYIQGVIKNDRAEQKMILQILKSCAASEDQDHDQNYRMTFIEEVAFALSRYFTKDRIKINPTIGNISLPLAIRPIHPGQAPLAIKVDGSYYQSHKAFEWEEKLEKLTRYMGLESINIWSKDWWQNPEKAVRKLASEIIKFDAAHE